MRIRVVLALHFAMATFGCLAQQVNGNGVEEAPALRQAKPPSNSNAPNGGAGWANCKGAPKCTATIQVLAHAGRNGGPGVLFHADESTWAVAGWPFPNMSSFDGTDSTQYDALSFWIRIESKASYLAPEPDGLWVSLAGPYGNMSTGQGIESCSRETEGGWRHVVVPIDSFGPLPSKQWNKKNVTGITVYTRLNGQFSFDLYLDDIKFERLDSKSLGDLCPAGSAASNKARLAQCKTQPVSACVERPSVDRDHDTDKRSIPALPKKPSEGRLPPEVIQETVRASYYLFRKCYEVGLARDRNLCGKVQVRFVIGDKGKVQSVQPDEGTTMLDCEVVQCVKKSFFELQFPEPAGGIVTVVYPIMFEPGIELTRNETQDSMRVRCNSS